MAWNNKDGNNLPHGNNSLRFLSYRKVPGLKNKRLQDRLFTVAVGENRKDKSRVSVLLLGLLIKLQHLQPPDQSMLLHGFLCLRTTCRTRIRYLLYVHLAVPASLTHILGKKKVLLTVQQHVRPQGEPGKSRQLQQKYPRLRGMFGLRLMV